MRSTPRRFPNHLAGDRPRWLRVVAAMASLSLSVAFCAPRALAGGSCFKASELPGCDNPACEAAVCAVDPICCFVAWDELCAANAIFTCIECDLRCPTGSVNEIEPCGLNLNGGCGAVPPLFAPISCGQSICGTAWAANGQRDTDWFSLQLNTKTTVTLSIDAEFPAVIGILNNGGVGQCVAGTVVTPYAVGPACSPVFLTTCLDAGTWWIRVAPIVFSGYPCLGGSTNYVLSLECGGTCTPPACGVDGTGSCHVPHTAPFCDDPACCAVICAFDNYCCEVEWDSVCVSNARSFCAGVSAPPNDACVDRIPIGDGIFNFTTFGAATDGPPLPAECDEGFGTSFVNDIWFEYTASCDGLVQASTCDGADFDTRMAIYLNSCDELTLAECNDDGPGCALLTSLATWSAGCGDRFIIRLGGHSGAGSGSLSVFCLGSCSPIVGDLDGNGLVDGADLGTLLSRWGTADEDADLDGSGLVDGVDLGTLLAHWTIAG